MIRLGRLLVELLPDTEGLGLLALMLLQESRRAARTSPTGDLVLLATRIARSGTGTASRRGRRWWSGRCRPGGSGRIRSRRRSRRWWKPSWSAASSKDYHLAHAVRADLCRRLGRTADARASYERALAIAGQEPEQRFLERRLNDLKA